MREAGGHGAITAPASPAWIRGRLRARGLDRWSVRPKRDSRWERGKQEYPAVVGPRWTQVDPARAQVEVTSVLLSVPSIVGWPDGTRGRA